MEEPITRAEYEEYQKRIEDEDHRQNKRIEQLEENTKQINALTVSIEKLAQSVESMVKEQEAQGKRLVSLESKDGEMWRKVVGYVITTIIGIAVNLDHLDLICEALDCSLDELIVRVPNKTPRATRTINGSQKSKTDE